MAATAQVFDNNYLLEMVLAHLESVDLFRLVRANKTWHASISNSPQLKRNMFLAQDKSSPVKWNPAMQRQHPELALTTWGCRIAPYGHSTYYWLYLDLNEHAGLQEATRPSRDDTSAVLSTYMCTKPIKGLVMQMYFTKPGGGDFCMVAKLDGNPTLMHIMQKVEETHAEWFEMRRIRDRRYGRNVTAHGVPAGLYRGHVL